MTKYSFEIERKFYDVPVETGEVVEYIEDFLEKRTPRYLPRETCAV